MASTIRVRAQAGSTSTEVQALIQHPMDSGFVKDSDGKLIPPHHIETVTFVHGGKTVLTANWGPAVSKDPYIKFSFAGGAKGDELVVTWIDNLGKTDTLTAKLT
jgi:sulfur-oxidizing protein SoxZ